MILTWLEDGGHPLHFKIIEIAGVHEGVTLYNGGAGLVMVDKVEDADAVWAGSIRFDGCANFDRSDRKRNVMDHLCGVFGLNARHQLFLKLYAIAAERMPQYKEYLT